MAICRECNSHIDSGYCGACLLKEVSKALVCTEDKPQPAKVRDHREEEIYKLGWTAGRKRLRKRIREALIKAKSAQRIV